MKRTLLKKLKKLWSGYINYNFSYGTIFLGGIVVFLSVSLFFHLFEYSNLYTGISPDSVEYRDAANLLVNELTGHPTRPIGFPLVIVFLKLLNGGMELNLYHLICIQFLFWIFSACILFKIFRLYYSPALSFFPTLIFLLSYGYIFHFFQYMTEPFFGFILIATIYTFVLFTKKRQDFYLILCLSLICFSILVRPVLLFSMIAFLLMQIAYFIKKRAYIKVLFSFAIPIFMIGSQVFLTYKKTDILKISFIGDITSYLYYDSYLTSKVKETPLEKRNDIFAKLINERRKEIGLPYNLFSENLLAKTDWAKTISPLPQKVISNILENPLDAAFVYARNFIQNCRGGTIRILSLEGNSLTIRKVFYYLSCFQNGLISFSFYLSVLFLIKYRSIFSKDTFLICIFCILIIFNISMLSPVSFGQGDRLNIVLFTSMIFTSFFIFYHIQFFRRTHIKLN